MGITHFKIKLMQNIVHLGDCMLGMAGFPDKYFDLAVVDPPYGINAEQGTNRASRKQFRDKDYGWDSYCPNQLYFNELIRVSKNQIIWGANHFIELIPDANSKSWLVWDKKNPDRCFADAELAWCSNIDNVRIINLKRVQELNRDDNGKIHPVQKPTALYDWIFKNYLPNGGKVLDTHGGSCSSRISADKAGNIDFTGYELDPEYWAGQERRYNDFKKQLRLF
jgi:site-specific DNA-methyltransferase (adenine-specific)